MENRRRTLDINVALIIQGLEDLKQHAKNNFEKLEKQISEKCLSCIYAEQLKFRAENNWWHIRAIWGIVGLIWGTIGTMCLIYLKQKAHMQ
jgi:hypothetical protein